MTRISPPYILAYLADSAGCGYHRIAQPMMHLLKSGHAYGRCDYTIWSPDRLVNLRPDIIIWQRQHEDYQIQNIEEARKALPDAFFCYEIDDILSAVPDWSPHRHHIPYDVDDRMSRALWLCDAVTVSTKTLGRHLKSLVGEGFDVRVSPNLIGRDELTQIDNLRSQNKSFHFKKRIGWGGGISHGGDLDLLLPAMREFRDKIEWVFLGQKPVVDWPVEFHGGVGPQEYLMKLASLDLDLMVAPLVDNHFNRCKSNLRLLEGGACKYPVIASPVEPYLDGNPPVFAYAEPDQWIEKIKQFLDDDKSGKVDSLRAWVERRYIYEDHLNDLIRYWSPRGTKPFVPKNRNLSTEKIVFVTSEPASVPAGYDTKSNLKDVVEQNCNVIYLRRGTWLTKEHINYILKYLVGNVSSICLLTNDGGFPKPGMFVGVDKEKADTINDICKRMFSDEAIQVPFPYGPVILLSRRALDACGFPNETTPESIENAITEWGVMTASRGFQSLLTYGMYTFSAFPPAQTNINALSQLIQARYNVQAPPDPLRDIRTALEIAFYRESYKDPLPSQNTGYDEWYSIYDTLSPRDAEIVKKYNEHCSCAAKYYDIGLWDKPDVEWVLFTRNDTILPGHVVYYFDKAFGYNPEAVFVYADNDFVTGEGKRCNHDFKPLKFDYDLLLGRDYVTPICAVRTKFIDEFLEQDKPVLQASLYDAALSCYDRFGIDGFVHVPRILGHLREQSVEERAAFAKAQRTAAILHLIKQQSKLTLKPHPDHPQYSIVNYSKNVPNPEPSVSIIIPTKNRVEMLSPCVESLLAFTNYLNYEVLIIDNGSTNPKHLEYRESLTKRFPSSRLRILSWPYEYNWAALNNWAFQQAKGDYLLFLNDDTRFAEPREWLSEMVGAAVRPDIGAVCAKLFYSSGMIQHVGVIASKGLCGHVHKMWPGQDPGYNGIAAISHANTAVTGACLLVSRAKFKEVGGFEERLAHNFNDVYFCIQLNRRGYVNLTVCSAAVQHLEGITRTSPGTPEGQATMREEAMLLTELAPEEDLYWNNNLLFFHLMGGMLVSGLNSDLMRWPPEKFDWRGDDWPKERVLLIGDDGTLWTEESRAGNICYFVGLNGYQMQIVRPTMDNVPPFDIRDEGTAVQRLTDLGISKVILRSILGGAAEVLPFIKALGFPVEYRPNSAESVCPRIDCKQNGTVCDSGWRDINICIECINTYNSPFGKISPVLWRDYWRELMNDSSYKLESIPADLKLPVLEVHTPKESYNV